MKRVPTHRALADAPGVRRTLWCASLEEATGLRTDVAQAVLTDRRRCAVKLALTTDPADAPADQDAPDPMPTTTAGKDR